jgi:hypothetical protein
MGEIQLPAGVQEMTPEKAHVRFLGGFLERGLSRTRRQRLRRFLAELREQPRLPVRTAFREPPRTPARLVGAGCNKLGHVSRPASASAREPVDRPCQTVALRFEPLPPMIVY